MMRNEIRQGSGMGMFQFPVTDLTSETKLEERIYTAAEIEQLLDQIRKVPHRICCLNRINQVNDHLRQALKGTKSS